MQQVQEVPEDKQGIESYAVKLDRQAASRTTKKREREDPVHKSTDFAMGSRSQRKNARHNSDIQAQLELSQSPSMERDPKRPPRRINRTKITIQTKQLHGGLFLPTTIANRGVGYTVEPDLLSHYRETMTTQRQDSARDSARSSARQSARATSQSGSQPQLSPERQSSVDAPFTQSQMFEPRKQVPMDVISNAAL